MKKATKGEVQRRYDAWSGWYDKIDTSRAFGGATQERWRRRAIEMLEAKPGETVLDLGTGSGLIIPWIAEKYPEAKVLGVDLSPKMLALARERAGEKAGFFLGDIDRLPFKDGSVDKAIATYTFTTAPEPRAMLVECARVMRSGGALVVLDTGPPTESRGKLLHAWMRLSAALFGYTRIERRLSDYLEGLPFENVVEERYYSTTVYVIRLKRR